MTKNQEKAKEIFEQYSEETVHFTADGVPFFSKNAAENHAKTLAAKQIETIERHEVIKPAPVADLDDEDNDEEEVEPTDEQKLAQLKAIPAEQLTTYQKGQITRLENKAKKADDDKKAAETTNGEGQ